MTNQLSFATEEAVGTCADGETVRYVVGHVVRTFDGAFADAVICGFARLDEHGTYVKLARPMAYAHLVGTTCASHALTCEEYSVNLQTLLDNNRKPIGDSSPKTFRHGPEPLGHSNKGQPLTIPEVLEDGIVVDTIRLPYDRIDDVTGEVIRADRTVTVARVGNRYTTQKVSLDREGAIRLAREAV